MWIIGVKEVSIEGDKSRVFDVFAKEADNVQFWVTEDKFNEKDIDNK